MNFELKVIMMMMMMCRLFPVIKVIRSVFLSDAFFNPLRVASDKMRKPGDDLLAFYVSYDGCAVFNLSKTNECCMQSIRIRCAAVQL
jgi:hypothetical protein